MLGLDWENYLSPPSLRSSRGEGCREVARRQRHPVSPALVSQGARMSWEAPGRLLQALLPPGSMREPVRMLGHLPGVVSLSGPQEQGGSAGAPRGSPAQPGDQTAQGSHGRVPNPARREDPEPVRRGPASRPLPGKLPLAWESLQVAKPQRRRAVVMPVHPSRERGTWPRGCVTACFWLKSDIQV